MEPDQRRMVKREWLSPLADQNLRELRFAYRRTSMQSKIGKFKWNIDRFYDGLDCLSIADLYASSQGSVPFYEPTGGAAKCPNVDWSIYNPRLRNVVPNRARRKSLDKPQTLLRVCKWRPTLLAIVALRFKYAE